MSLRTAAGPKPRVAVIYDGFPHYRKGVIEALASSELYDYYFFGDATYRDASIKAYDFEPGINVVRTRSFYFGRIPFQTGILKGLWRHRISQCIFLGNPRFASYWIAAPLLRLLGKKVYFWTHGWLDASEPRFRRAFKQTFFRLADGVLLYGHRAREIGLTRGFPARRLYVIGNSLDYGAQKKLFESLAGVSPADLRRELQLPLDRRVIICTARVTQKCRFDLLIRAAGRLRLMHRDVFLVIVGDGPERDALAALAAALRVEHKFWGACYDELTIAKLYKASDLTVSPGKVGLTAMHSMAYGTPVISHGNFDHQMPEYEAIVPGVTGNFFAEDSSEDLTRVIFEWFENHPHKPERACIDRIEAEFTPAFQRRAIESALHGEMPAS